MAKAPSTAPLAVEKFGGMVPILDDRVIPDTFSSFCENTALQAQVLEGYNIPRLVHTLANPAAQYAYRIPLDYTKSGLYDPSFWMEFNDPDTVVVRSQIVEDSYDRYYWCVPGQPLHYNTKARIIAGQPPYVLGVPLPAVAPGVVVSGGSGDIVDTRAYVYTWVTEFGEEGPPSPATVVTGLNNATWTITVTAPTAADTTSRSLTKTRIYRTITSNTGVATFFEVVELPIATLTYADTVPDATVSGQPQLESTAWLAPPVLDGIAQMPNGFLVGWRGTDVFFCEPYRPHAWPMQYGLSIGFPVVGTGVFGQSAILCTSSEPSVVSGVHPSNMTQQKIDVIEPCLARGSIVVGLAGVFYASHNGLMQVSPSGVINVTKDLFGARTWADLVNPYGLRGVRYAGVFISFDTTGAIGQFGGIIDPSDQRVAFTRIKNARPVQNIWIDDWSGKVTVIAAAGVHEFDPNDENVQIPFTWKSKKFRAMRRTNLGVAKVYFDQTVVNPTDNPWALAVDNIDLGPLEQVRLKVWADDELVFNEEVTRSDEQISLPGGFKALWWQFEIAGRTRIVAVHLARDIKDLASV